MLECLSVLFGFGTSVFNFVQNYFIYYNIYQKKKKETVCEMVEGAKSIVKKVCNSDIL